MTNQCCGLAVIFCSFILHLIGRQTIIIAAIHAASHVDLEKRVARVSISMHASDLVPIVIVLRLAAVLADGAPP